MQKTKKILSMLLAFVMVFAVAAPVFAVGDETTNSVTLHKILMDKTTFSDFTEGTTGKDGTEYIGKEITNVKDFFAGTDSSEDAVAKEIAGAYFAVKYDSGSNKGKYVTYKEADGKVQYSAVESLDVTEEQLDGYKLLAGKTEANGITFTTKGLSGDFLIEEHHDKSSYVGKDGETLTDMKAVPVKITLPLINNDGVVVDAHVYPKNTEEKPSIDKNFKSNNGLEVVEDKNNTNNGANYDNSTKEKATAKAELGKKIPYEVKTQIPQNAKYKKLVWDDQMQKGLVYNRDLEISGVNLEKGTDYKLYETDRGFRLVMQDSGLTKVENAAKEGNVEITLTYSAHLDGTVKPDEVKENNVTFDYSNKPGFENEPPEVKPSEGKITVEKSWAADGKVITEADRHVKAVFTLQEKQEDGSWKDVAEHVSNYNEGFTHTFENLNPDKTYRVVESVSGYEPQYQKTTEDGKVVIVNKIDNDNPKTLKPTTPKVVNGGKRFVKTNQNGSERLAGAQFIVLNEAGTQYLVAKSSTEKDAANIDVSEKKTALDKAIKAYNDLSAEEQKGTEGTEAKNAIDKAQKAYNDAVKEAAKAYDWVDLPKTLEDKKAPEGAVVLTSDSQGRFEITGLEYGTYKLKEIVPPAGYAKLNDGESFLTFKVEEGSYTTKDVDIKYNTDDEANSAQQIINKKVSIPQTGGIGTIIFAAVGIALMVSAVVAMKKREAEEI